jgi:hypothetical protein
MLELLGLQGQLDLAVLAQLDLQGLKVILVVLLDLKALKVSKVFLVQ